MQKRFRLRKRTEFSRVYGTGRSAAGRVLVLYVLPSEGELRIGFSAGKKLGNAVVRNRAKRRLKEVVRKNLRQLAQGHFYVLIARSGAVKASLLEMEREFISVAKRLKIWVGPWSRQRYY